MKKFKIRNVLVESERLKPTVIKEKYKVQKFYQCEGYTTYIFPRGPIYTAACITLRSNRAVSLVITID